MMLQSMNTYITCKAIFTLNLRLIIISFILLVTSFQCDAPQLKVLDQHDAPQNKHLSCKDNQTDKKPSAINLGHHSLNDTQDTPDNKRKKLENEPKNIQESLQEEITKCIAEAEKHAATTKKHAADEEKKEKTKKNTVAVAEKYAEEAATNATRATETEKRAAEEEEKNRTNETETHAADAKKHAVDEVIKAKVAKNAAEIAKNTENLAGKNAAEVKETVKCAIEVAKYATDPNADLNILIDKEGALTKQRELLTIRISYQTKKPIQIAEKTTSKDQEVSSEKDNSSMAAHTENSVTKTECNQNKHTTNINFTNQMQKVLPISSTSQPRRSTFLNSRKLFRSQSTDPQGFEAVAL